MKKEQKAWFQVSLKVLLVNSRGKILILKAAKSGSFQGYYDLPGGRINVGEIKKPIAGLIRREIKEEVGEIKYELQPTPVAFGRHVIPAKFNSSKKPINVFYVFFIAKYKGEKIKISREHQGFKWVNLSKIKLEKYFKSGILEGVKKYTSSPI
ncbi:MAG: NUDIX domain-containing protein [Patescibacteria group bacterium]|jgi:8-oxo-dGTP pyrophosphatase MutT (NUDIX family)